MESLGSLGEVLIKALVESISVGSVTEAINSASKSAG